MSTRPFSLSASRPASDSPLADAGAARAGGASGSGATGGFLAGVGERELVRRAQGGSVDAFGTLVERYEGRVLALLRFRLRPEVEAEDVAQETFMRAWTRLDQFDPGRELAPWLLTIAVRTAVAHNRKARSRHGLNERAATLKAAEGEGARDAPPRGEGADRRIWEIARGCLSEESVTALWLRYGEGMSMREIGVALGWTELHARVALSRGRKRLRAALDSAEERGKTLRGREVSDE